MPNHHWQNAEYERIARTLTGRPDVRAVSPSGSFASGTHDALSDLDLTVVGLDPADVQAVLGRFDAANVLGQERYIGPGAALYRVLLASGRQYDIKVLRTEQSADDDVLKVTLGGTDEFWFALHAAHHALVRGREVVALDLVLASCRAVTQAYWDVPKTTQAEIRSGLRQLEVGLDSTSLAESIAYVGTLAGLAFDDEERARAFSTILSGRTRAWARQLAAAGPDKSPGRPPA
ncbi:MAG: hypothetical protein AAGJ11_00460 [Bacteroidota bacterium]